MLGQTILKNPSFVVTSTDLTGDVRGRMESNRKGTDKFGRHGTVSARKWFLHLLLLLFCSALHAQQAGTVTYVYTDPQGTPLAEADSKGNITATFDYTPYGTTALGTPPNGPGYTGHVNDPETNLVYMVGRYYDSATGHFLSVDPESPLAGSAFTFNRYAYASNNPIVNSDPNGRQTADDYAKLNGCPAGACSLVMMGGQWQVVAAGAAAQSDLAQDSGIPIASYVNPQLPTRQEAAVDMDHVNLGATATTFGTATWAPPVAVAAGVVDEGSAVVAWLLDPSWSRATNVMTAGLFAAAKASAKGTKAAVKAVEQSEQANRAVTILTAMQPGYPKTPPPPPPPTQPNPNTPLPSPTTQLHSNN